MIFIRFVLEGSKQLLTAETSTSAEKKEIKNPKIANMLPAYEHAQYQLILISDSGVMMLEDALYDMATLMTDRVGLVHQMPFTCDKQGFAGSLEKVNIVGRTVKSILSLSLSPSLSGLLRHSTCSNVHDN